MPTWRQPSEIRYSQASIKSRFSNRRQLGIVLDDICDEKLKASNFPNIRVIKKDGLWFSMDNRRLWVFKQLQRLGKCGDIPVKEVTTIPDERHTTRNNGVHVEIRGLLGGEWKDKPDCVDPRPPFLCTWATSSRNFRGRSGGVISRRRSWESDDDFECDYGDDSEDESYDF
ncbi:hypothetical protein MAR_024954 [Mya arenaria]|uniref:Uncharacterized protein n=1 Tax=Mya arenaria TaxID=6604 RepID=A0ABY7DVD7_MYAAR|nr:uncharacterized protein LOC128227569 [Mya arenaria]WAR00582.1 hypothetical protein MAR_024954 [Mya arenaria]